MDPMGEYDTTWKYGLAGFRKIEDKVVIASEGTEGRKRDTGR